MPEPKTAREVAEVVLAHLIGYDTAGHAYDRDVYYLTAELELWASRPSGPAPAVASCQYCDWTMSFSAETVVEEATVLRQACIDHCQEAHPEKFETPKET